MIVPVAAVLASIFGTVLTFGCEAEDLPLIQIETDHCPERGLATNWLQVDVCRPDARLAYAYGGNSVGQAGLPQCFGDSVPHLRILRAIRIGRKWRLGQGLRAVRGSSESACGKGKDKQRK